MTCIISVIMTRCNNYFNVLRKHSTLFLNNFGIIFLHFWCFYVQIVYNTIWQRKEFLINNIKKKKLPIRNTTFPHDVNNNAHCIRIIKRVSLYCYCQAVCLYRVLTIFAGEKDTAEKFLLLKPLTVVVI